MKSIFVAYLIINLCGALYEILVPLIKGRLSETNDQIDETYNSMNSTGKILLYTFTFIVNIIFWLPFKLVKPIMKS